MHITSINYWNDYEYDENGNRSRNISRNSDGTVKGYTKFEYLENGNREIFYDRDGKVTKGDGAYGRGVWF